jgi:hypothetical protein
VLLEKGGLCSDLFGFPKVAQPYADEPVALLWTQGHSFSQPHCDVRQLITGGGRRAGRMAASKNFELACLHFQDHRACCAGFFARSRPKLFCKAPDHGLGLCQQNILLKSILDGYRLRRPVRDDFAIVDTAGELVQAPTIAAEVVFEHGQIHTSQVAHSLYSKFPQLVSCNFADSRQAPNRQRQKKRVYVLRPDDKELIRFAPVGGEFC